MFLAWAANIRGTVDRPVWSGALGFRAPRQGRAIPDARSFLVRQGRADTMALVDCNHGADGADRACPVSVGEIAGLLASQDSVPSRGGASGVEHIETHLSHVFLCRDLVYKLLKPVHFAFVDFSTVDRRRDECRAEVELNRALASDVYLAAEPVWRLASGGVRIGASLSAGEEGSIADWAVKMRRLPADRTLESLVARGEATTGHIQSLAATLVRYYATTTRAAVTAGEYVAAVEHHVRDNLAELSRGEHGLPRCLIERVHAAQLTTLALHRTLFEDRVAAGLIVQGHGDLRPEHVYFVPEPVVIDCLAFSRDLRTLDIADEIAFLAMELRRLGSPALADALIVAYEQGTTDRPPAELWAFYQAYRACVRAKVAALRAAQLSETRRNEAQRTAELSAAKAYLDLADAASKPLGRPMCIAVRGLSGTGKSTLAAALAHKLGATHLQTDVVRRQLFPSAAPATYGQGCYTTAARRMVYDALLAQACERLVQRQSVIVDGTFLTTASRAMFAELASRRNAVLAVLACRCPLEVAADRIAVRTTAGASESDANIETLRRQVDDEEPDPPGVLSREVDTTVPLACQVEAACHALSDAGERR